VDSNVSKAPETKEVYSVVHGVRGLTPPSPSRELVFTWPHVFIRELVMALAVTVGILAMSLAFNAPLEQLANPALTPNPAKAPWYFLNLQEMLHYFPPNWAGVFIPGMIIVGLMSVPYIDRNPSMRIVDRPFAVGLWNFFVSIVAVLTYIGVFFRGPGWEWAWPWKDGIFTTF
jgi:quinol-cytochrome oxidoreductase complex cytochrome b subunit